MVQKLEEFYIQLHNIVMGISISRDLENPCRNPFIDKNSISNAVIKSFGELNKAMSMLGLDCVDVEKFLGDLRHPRTDNEKTIFIVRKLNHLFNRSKGMCINEIRKKLEMV